MAENLSTVAGGIMNAVSLASDRASLENNRRQTLQEESAARTLLAKLANNWGRRAQVKRPELEVDTLCDESKDDFLPALLPFKDHPAYRAAPESMRQKVLSCGWLAYNEKTVDIEAKVIAPACLHVVYGEVPGLRDGLSIRLASQTLVDEAYHIFLVTRACQVTRERRDLLSVALPESNLVLKMRKFQEQYSERWQKILVQLATAIVSEVFISDYLKLLSSDMSIQPFNRLTVDAHRRDELAHSSIFKSLTRCIYTALGMKERAFFMDVLPKPVRWFANVELDMWHAMLQQIGFLKADAVINACKSMNEENLARIDFSDLIALAAELGILETQRGVESFHREGLMDDRAVGSDDTFSVSL
jgi:hypothetical protein